MRKWSSFRLRLALLLAGALAAGPAIVVWAEEAAGGPAPEQGFRFFEVAKNASFMEYVLLLVSIIGVAFFLQALVTIRAHLLRPPELADDLVALCEEGNVDEALNVAQADNSFLGVAAHATLSKVQYGKDAMESALADAGEIESHKFMTRISTLNLIAAIAPMLGLTGTTYGMIQTFWAINKAGDKVTTSQMAEGISVALVCTFTGLMVAIPLLVGAFFLKARLMQVIYEISNDCNEMIRTVTSGEEKAP